METEDLTILYPSGSIAATVSKVHGDCITTIFSPKGKLLLLYNEKGIGSAHFKSGKPWLVSSDHGFSITDETGAVIERGAWPRSASSSASLDVNEYLNVTFSSKTDIVATLRIGENKNVFQCGEQLRRADTQLNLDITSIRARQKASGPSGSVYVQPGPHHFKTAAPGVGSLKSTIRSLSSQSPVSETVKALSSLDGRLSAIDLWGGGSGKSLSSTSLTSTLGSTMRKKNLPEDFGSPEMTESMIKNGRRPKPIAHKNLRKKLAWMAQSEAIKGGEAAKDEILVCYFCADWNPVCATIEAQVEQTCAQVSDDPSLATNIKIVKVSASEGSLFKTKYNVRSAPFFFFYFEGQLVEATNNLRTSSEIKAAAINSLAKGRKKEFLSESFTFLGRLDNTLLDNISQGIARC